MKRTPKMKIGSNRETAECSLGVPVPVLVVREITGGNGIKTHPDEPRLPELE